MCWQEWLQHLYIYKQASPLQNIPYVRHSQGNCPWRESMDNHSPGGWLLQVVGGFFTQHQTGKVCPCFTDRDHPVSNVLFPKDTSPLPTETGLMVPQWLLALRNAFSFYPPSYLLQKKAIKDIKLILGVKSPLHAYIESQGVIPASATQSLFMRSDVQWSCSQVGKHV